MARLTPIRLALLQDDRTQTWLAEQVDVSRPEMSRIVNGLLPDSDVMARVCIALGRSESVLFPHLKGESDHTSTGSQTSRLEAA